MSEPVVLDIETSGELPWTGQLVAVGVGTEVLKPEEGMAKCRDLLMSDAIVICHTNYDLRWLALNGAPMSDELQFHDSRLWHSCSTPPKNWDWNLWLQST